MSVLENEVRQIVSGRAVENSLVYVQPASHRDATSAPTLIPGVELIRGDSITPKNVEWVWPRYFARGKLHVVAGAPGTGKTTILLDAAARITRGRAFPDETQPVAPGDIVMWSGEDDLEDTLAPRLIAAGADMSRVHFVGAKVDANGNRRSFDPSTDLAQLSAAIHRCLALALVIVDPLVAVSTRDSHKNAETRRDLTPLQDLAVEHNAPVVGIAHFSKGMAGRDPLERLSGSLAFGAVPRIVLGTAKRNAESSILVRIKTTNSKEGDGFAYSIRAATVADEIKTTRIAWLEPIFGSPQDLFAAVEPATDEHGGKQAITFLRDTLGNGSLPKDEIERRANEAGLAMRTVERAMNRAGVESKRIGFGGKAVWSLKT